MINKILLASSLYIKYIAIYIFLLLIGRAFTILIEKYFLKTTLSGEILETKRLIFYPIIGAVFVGNLLILINYFLPLKNLFVYVMLMIFLLPNFYKLKINLDFKKILNIENIIYYLVIPSILVVSSYDTSFHFDGGY